jgi:inorganic pyrophosphatase
MLFFHIIAIEEKNMSVPEPFFRFRPHPWHGLSVGPNPPEVVHAYIELTPFDRVKYEIDKETGYLRVDRPHRASSVPPNLYGFIPKTFCGKRVAALSVNTEKADGDPLDICVISERPISQPEVILNAKVVGGLQMIDQGEADDKIIAVLANDNLYAHIDDISELPDVFVERLRHYFSTYKMIPGQEAMVEISDAYGREHAIKVINASIADYEETYGSE